MVAERGQGGERVAGELDALAEPAQVQTPSSEPSPPSSWCEAGLSLRRVPGLVQPHGGRAVLPSTGWRGSELHG